MAFLLRLPAQRKRQIGEFRDRNALSVRDSPKKDESSAQGGTSRLSTRELLLSLPKGFRPGKVPFNSADSSITPIQLSQASFRLLRGLPPELILEIADWLDVPSSAALALCDHRMFAILSKSCLAALKKGTVQRDIFLRILDRDLEASYFCIYRKKIQQLRASHYKKIIAILGVSCSKDRRRQIEIESLFPQISKSRYRPSEIEIESLYPQISKGLFRPFAYNHAPPFGIEHAQVAAKLYRRGSMSDANYFLKCALISQPRSRVVSRRPDNWGFYLFEALPIQGQICARSQLWMFVSKRSGYKLPDYTHFHICKHMPGTSRPNNVLSRLLKRQLENLAAGHSSCSYCSSLLHCAACFLDVFVDARVVTSDPRIQVLRITKWQYMAIGSSPITIHEDTNSSVSKPTRGETRAAYERATMTPFQSIISIDEAWKAMKRYRWFGF